MRCTEHLFPASYGAIHRFVQPRDLAIVHAVWRYKFLTAPQLLELWWPDAAAWAGQRRLLKLFQAGYLDRFRPVARRGSHPCARSLNPWKRARLLGAGSDKGT